MMWLVDHAYVAAVVPFVLALVVGLLGRKMLGIVPWVTLLSPLTVLATGVAAVVGDRTTGASASWLFGDAGLQAGWHIDPLTSIMLVVVGFVACMVVTFSVGYMHGDPGITRYFALLSLFTGAMTVLVLSDGLAGLFIGWELVGACSYLLIGFWHEKPSAAAAAIKAFLTTRVGDIGMLLGIAVLWREVGSLQYTAIAGAAESLPASTVSLVALLLFVGAAGKSAQFPLHIWLPDAMEGPTPVSALIHAATMVAAGVFLVARVWPLFEASPDARGVVLVIGVFTALASATAAVAQTDIKKVLAYSTISQLGFMFAALGAGAWVAAMFHLCTHAAFKALLFLCSGSVIHGTGTQDMREMGGLAKSMRATTITWIIGAAALAGVPVFSGFFSKDEVVASVWEHSPVAGAVLLLASLLTAFYITRATRLTFFGDYRGDGHPHEGGATMWLPLVLLAVPAAVAGFAATWFAEFLGEHGEGLSLPIASASIVIAAVGITVGWVSYRDGAEAEERISQRFAAVWPVLRSAYGFDGFVLAAVVRPVTATCGALYRIVDRAVIDGVVEGVGTASRGIGAWLNKLQFGDAQWYAALLGAGAVLLAALAIMGTR